MKLEEYGFRLAGEWEPPEGVRDKIRFRLSVLADERVVYAFVVDGEPKYVGVCEARDTTLKKRMGHYRSADHGTNRRIAALIRDALAAGQAVHIHALKPDDGCEYRGVAVDLVKGLENPLVDLLKPEWNLRK